MRVRGRAGTAASADVRAGGAYIPDCGRVRWALHSGILTPSSWCNAIQRARREDDAVSKIAAHWRGAQARKNVAAMVRVWPAGASISTHTRHWKASKE